MDQGAGAVRLRRVGDAIALGLMLALLALHVSWARLDHTLPHDDDASLFNMSLCVDELLSSSALPHPETVRRCLPTAPYPPLVPLVAALHYRLLGERSVEVAVLSLWPWLVVLMGALYLSLRAEGGVMLGLAGLALGPPLTYVLGIRAAFYTEPAVAALCVASVGLLVASQGFTRLLPSALLGLSLGLGLLAKWSFAFFMGPTMAMAVLARLYHLGARPWVGAAAAAWGALTLALTLLDVAGVVPLGGMLGVLAATFGVAAVAVVGMVRPDWLKEHLPGLGGMALTAGVVVVVAGPWYLLTLSKMQIFLGTNTTFAYAGDKMTLAQSWAFYPAAMALVVWTPLWVGVAVSAARSLLPSRSALASWSLLALVSGTVVLATLPYRHSRYLMAGVALVAAPALLAASRPRWLAGGVGAAGLAAGLVWAFGWTTSAAGGEGLGLPRALSTDQPALISGNFLTDVQLAREMLATPRWTLDLSADPPEVRPWPVGRAMKVMGALSGEGKPWYLLVIDPTRTLNGDGLWGLARARGAPEGTRVLLELPGPEPTSILARAAQTLPPTWSRELPLPGNFFALTLATPVEQEAELRVRGVEATLYEMDLRVVWTSPVAQLPGATLRLWRQREPAPALASPLGGVKGPAASGSFYPAFTPVGP